VNSKNYNDCIRHETIRVAVCDMMDSTIMPEPLKSVMFSLFPSFVESYEVSCLSSLVKDGQPLVDPFGNNTGRFMFSPLLEKISELKTRLLSHSRIQEDID